MTSGSVGAVVARSSEESWWAIAAARVSSVPVLLLGGFVYLIALGARLPIAITKPLDGDEAVQGIAALRLLDSGDWTWFFPGQHYAGMLETIPQALLQAIDKGNVFLLRLPLILIAAGAVLLLACLALELTRSRITFLAVGALAALFPPTFVYLGSWQTAGYNTSIFLGVTVAYLLAIALRPVLTEHRRWLLVGMAGLSAGLAVYEQPLSTFVIAALCTTVLVATWPRPVELLRPRHLLAFAALAVLGASPQIVEALGGVGTDATNNPVPPGYDLSSQVLLAVAGLPLPSGSGALEYIGYPGGHESMTWNVLGVQGVHDLLVPEALAVALSVGAWALILGTLVLAFSRRRSARGTGAEVASANRLPVALAAGVLVAAIVVILAIVRLPPLSKYAFGLCGFAAFGLAIVATRRGPRPTFSALLAVGLLALMAASCYATLNTFLDLEQSDTAREQRSWLQSRIDEVPAPPDEDKVLYGDYWLVYPLEFMSGGELRAHTPFFDRFPERGAGGGVPAGRVIVPVIPDLAFQDQVDVDLRDHCTVRSAEEGGVANLLVADCRPR
jgi:hypothetical protein